MKNNPTALVGAIFSAAMAVVLLLKPVLLQAQGDPAQVGQWSAVISLPIVPIHVSLLPNDKLLMWNHQHTEHTDSNGKKYVQDNPTPYLWNPNVPFSASNPILISVPERFANGQHSDQIYCTGHSFQADGTLLVAGGHLAKFNSDASNKVNLEVTGSPQIHFFDYRSNTWLLNQVQMNEGRWYPTTLPLGNGNTLVVGGLINQGADANGNPIDQYFHNPIPQIYNSTSGTFTTLSSASRELPTYPWMYAVPGGTPATKAFYAGPGPDSGFLNLTGQGSWGAAIPTTFGVTRSPGAVHKSTSVLYDQGKVLNVGGVNMRVSPDENVAPPTNRAEIIDLNVGSPGWTEVTSMNYPRQYLNATLLPDGKVLVTGGTSSAGFSNASGAVLVAEMWDPSTRSWSVMKAMDVPRLHHSFAILLPDGRVMVGGGGETYVSGEVDHPDVQFYSPPYLFKGARPVVTSISTSVIKYGQQFSIQTSDTVSKVTLIKRGSVTHGFNENQAVGALKFKKRGGSPTLNVTGPTDRNVVPPGHYLLFIVNSNGVPSVAQSVQVTP